VSVNWTNCADWSIRRVRGAAEQARRHLTRSIKLSQATGARVGVARGLEAFAALAVQDKQPGRAVQLAAAAVALAVEVRPSRAPADGDGRGLTVVAEPEALSSRRPGRAASGRQVH
jgi:hypothetical protein